jgi:acyl dehydratase
MAAIRRYFEDLRPGERTRTAARTVSETEIVQFVQLAGYFEPLFIDMDYVERETVFGKRIAPGALTFAIAEGLSLTDPFLTGAGMAFLGLSSLQVPAPVFAGDTIHVEIEVIELRATRKSDRGIGRFSHTVRNQRGEIVMTYEITRMLHRRPDASAASP